MNQEILISISGILAFGLLAQWLSWKFIIPSILPLLVFGFVAGPVTGLLNPDKSFGNVLFPLVSVSVAIILFEGGANLKFSELKQVGNVIRNLVTTGIIVTWILSTAAAYLILQLSFSLSILLGAILVVTGPTVILPIIRNIRPIGQLGAVLKWEGIINDPIGAMLAILVFEGIIAGGIGEATQQVIGSIFKVMLFSSTTGVGGALIMVILLKKKLIPEFLQNSFSIALVILVYTASNLIQKESGLFAVTIMGIILANQKHISIKHLIEFKEILRTILLSFLFMVLAARIDLDSFKNLGWESAVFIFLVIFLIRPAAVLLSAIRSPLTGNEKIYLSFMAPRGVVAAAVVSVFSIELINAGNPDAEILVPIMFLVIITTIAVYGLSAMPFAKLLKIADADPQGVLIAGAHPLARAIAKALDKEGFKVLLVDTNIDNINAARNENLPVYYGSILAEGVLENFDLTGIGKFIALTPNKEVNSLAILYFAKILGSASVYQLNVDDDMKTKNEVTRELKGRILFDLDVTLKRLLENFNQKVVRTIQVKESFSYEDFKIKFSDVNIIPLFLITETRRLIVISENDKPNPRPGQTLILFFER